MQINSKRHICIFSAQYLPHMGGIENFTFNLAKSLITKGFMVTVITSNTDNWATKEVVEGISIIRLPVHNFIGSRYPIIKMNKCFRHLKKDIYSIQFDFVIVNARFYIHSIFGLKMAYKKSIPAICIDHGTTHLTVHNKVLDLIGGEYEHFITWIDKHYCNDFYGVSPASLEWLKHFHIQGKGILYNSIDPDRIESILKTHKHLFRDEFMISKNSILMTFTGRLLAEKGIPQLIKATECLVENDMDLELFVAGEGPLDITTKCRNIHLLGRLSFEDVIHLLDETDIFILPSDSEGFSTSILEAGFCNCYVIANDTGGIQEVLRNPEYGIVMSDNTEKTIIAAIKNAVNKKEEWNNAEKLTKENILMHFTWEHTADEVIRIFESMSRKKTEDSTKR